MNDLELRLHDLGELLTVNEVDLVDDVMLMLAPSGRRSGRLWLRVAAAAVLVLAIAIAIPSSRRAIARVFSLDGVNIQQTERTAPESPDPIDIGLPGGSRVFDIDGTRVSVTVIHVRLDKRLIKKLITGSTTLREVEVRDQVGIWIAGEPHEVLFLDPEGDVVSERVAGNTLMWNEHGRVVRVEGFESLDAAVSFATGLVFSGP
jgi:hypothetical protein